MNIKENQDDKGISNKDIASILGCSERSVIRWKKETKTPDQSGSQITKMPRKRAKQFSPEIYQRIDELKEEAPARTATTILRKLQEEITGRIPSISSIRNYLRERGYSKQDHNGRQGYIKFERKSPNDLWQIDIAGVQTVGHLGKTYLIAILDDSSRYIVSARYFQDQRGVNVFKVLRDAFNEHGRPNQIIADNGTQFRNVTKNLLTSLDIKPIFSSPYHPQSKGKLERWFGTVRQLFLPEGRLQIRLHPDWTLIDFNGFFYSWLEWYNFKKQHRSLPKKCPPANKFLDIGLRISRPLNTIINWNNWITTFHKRKVTKTNSISFQGETIQLPTGYVDCKVDLNVLDTEIEIYHQGRLIKTFIKDDLVLNPHARKSYRRIAQNGTIQYQKKYYSIDYKLAGKKVEIKESFDATELYFYIENVLVKRLSR
ncbi:MAG: DDE-type integrase/transposase/recombinase [Promethearchaeota archaeon]